MLDLREQPDLWDLAEPFDDTGLGEPRRDPAVWHDEGDLEAFLHAVAEEELPAERLEGGLRSAGVDLERAVLGEDDLARVLSGSVVAALESVGRLRAQLDAAAVALACEALRRGLNTEVGLLMVDWLRVRCPWLSRQQASELVDIARAGTTPTGAPLADLVISGRAAPHRAAKVARTMTRLSGVLDPDQREAYTQIAADAAADTGIDDVQLGVVCAKLLEDLLDEEQRERRERTAHELRTVTTRRLATGLTRVTVDADDASAATLHGVFSSQLAAPCPTEEGPDLRTPGQRRFDALMTVINRGLDNPGAPPSTARSTIIITLPFDPEAARPAGPASTPTGDILTRHQVEQLACHGEITPVWLSPEGEPLRLGKTARLATPGQWKALVARDRHCTFPGCTIPPQWCDSHHLVWWCRGGDTDIDLLALLCQRHHTQVHQKDIVGEVVGGTVVWHV